MTAVSRPRLFEPSYAPPPLGLLAPGVLGESGWVKALRLDGYVRRGPRKPEALQDVLFLYWR